MEAPAIGLKTLASTAGAILLLEGGAHVLVQRFAAPALLTIGSLRAIEAVVLYVIVSLSAREGTRQIGLQQGKWLAGVKAGLIWSLGFGLLVGLVGAAFILAGARPIDFFKTTLPSKQEERMLFFLVGGFISPITEEFFFRGVLFGFFRKWGAVAAILASALLFVLAHMLSSNTLPLPQMVGGILFAVAYEKEKNLIVPILLHVLGNLAIFTLGVIAA